MDNDKIFFFLKQLLILKHFLKSIPTRNPIEISQFSYNFFTMSYSWNNVTHNYFNNQILVKYA